VRPLRTNRPEWHLVSCRALAPSNHPPTRSVTQKTSGRQTPGACWSPSTVHKQISRIFIMFSFCSNVNAAILYLTNPNGPDTLELHKGNRCHGQFDLVRQSPPERSRRY